MRHTPFALILPWLCSALLLGACASTQAPAAAPTTPQPNSPTTGASAAESARLETEFVDALSAPLADLNLIRKTIPPVLEAARQAPYAPPSAADCAGLRLDIEALNRVLGADLDTPASADNPSLIERGSDLASDAVVDAVRDGTTGILPFRGWIRRLSGANKHAKAVIAAISAGAVRRAYLKGLGQAQGCASPAAPALASTAPAAPTLSPTPAPTPLPKPQP
ncbi:MAG: hypothetical protein ACH34Y_05310 [Brachymonas sp.]|jgi:hypothetical protein